MTQTIAGSGPMRRECLHRVASGGGTIHHTYADARRARIKWEWRRRNHPNPLEPTTPATVGIFSRIVTDWKVADR